MDKSFHNRLTSGVNQQALSFKSTDDQSEMMIIGGLHRMNRASSLNFSGNSGSGEGSSSFTGIGNSCESHVVDSVTELKQKHPPGLDGDWSVEEQYKLEQALVKYADEFGMIRYVKIAATLRNKTVRDVAIRCRWMATWQRKRKMHDERSLWKKAKDEKDKFVESSSRPSVPSVSTINVALLSTSMNRRIWGDRVHFEALLGSIRHLLEQNNRVLVQISTNISTLNLQDNIDLFIQMKNNITAILNDMRCMPWPPLPVSLNEDLANTILSIKAQTMFVSSGGMIMKQEPWCW